MSHFGSRAGIKTLVVAGLLLAVNGWAQEATGSSGSARDLSLQFSRYDQLIDRLMQQNQGLMGDVRQLQRDNLMLKKQLEENQNRVQTVSDENAKLQNLTVGNLASGQKQLAQQVSQLNEKNQKSSWGDGTRDCAQLGVKHQQIKVQVSPDGNKSIKFLCYDGKVLHLGTEVHDLGQ